MKVDSKSVDAAIVGVLTRCTNNGRFTNHDVDELKALIVGDYQTNYEQKHIASAIAMKGVEARKKKANQK